MPKQRMEAHYDYVRAGDAIVKVLSPGRFLIEREGPLPDRPYATIRETTDGFDSEWVRFPDGRWVNADGSSLTEKGIAAIDVYEVIR